VTVAFRFISERNVKRRVDVRGSGTKAPCILDVENRQTGQFHAPAALPTTKDAPITFRS
jgi:hypothetical protein